MSDPRAYNQKQMDTGELRDDHILTMVESFQQANGLKVDGYCGPKTLAAIERQWPYEESNDLGLTALAVAVECLGEGEVGGNNSGPFVEMLLGKEYDGDDDDDGAWCAAFVSHCFKEAAKLCKVELSFKTSFGAKRLFRNVAKAGQLVDIPVPGDIVCWDRGTPGSWQGHIGIVEKYEDGILHTIEGNTGRYPSKVRRLTHDLSKDKRLEGFARAWVK